MSAEMIACCGLVCTRCDAYLATQANDLARARDVQEGLLDRRPTDPEVTHSGPAAPVSGGTAQGNPLQVPAEQRVTLVGPGGFEPPTQGL